MKKRTRWKKSFPAGLKTNLRAIQNLCRKKSLCPVQRMIFHITQVIQAHIGSDLKLQYSSAFQKGSDQFLPLFVFQVRSIQTMPDPDLRHFLPRLQRLLHTQKAGCHIIPQAVSLPGVYADHK